ncbi:MAG: hypothetical protein Kow00120_18870 [Anaerolineae bacterium]
MAPFKTRHFRAPAWMIHPLALALYAATTVVAMWALFANLGTAVPGGQDTDYNSTHWSLWWFRFALSRGWDPMFTDWVLFPLEHNLSIHMLTPSLFPAYALAEPLFGRVAAVNLISMGIVTLSAYMMFVFVRGHLRLRRAPNWADDALALVSGFVFGFLPYQISHAALSHLNLTPIFWVPLILWLWDRAATARAGLRRVVWAAAMGVALWGAWLTDLQYLMWMPLVAGLYGLYLLARAENHRARLALVGLAALALAVTLALGSVIPLPALRQVDSSQFAPADLYVARFLSMPLGALLLAPGPEDRGFGRWLVLLTVASVLLVAVLRRRRAMPGATWDAERWVWLLTAVTPLVLALGPDITVGEQVIPLPYRILHDAMQGQYRNPVRFVVPGVFGLILFCALSWRPVLARLRRPAARAGLVAVVLAAFTLDLGLLQPFPVLFPPDYAIYHEIGAEPGDYVILEVPVGVHSGWTGMGDGKRLQYYAPDHQKKLVNGSISRIPWQDHDFYADSRLLSWLAGDADFDTQAAPRELAQAVEEWPVGYVIVHPDLIPEARLPEYLGFLNVEQSVCFYKAEVGLFIYRAHWHPEGCPPRTPPQDASGAYVIDLGAPGDEPFFGEYWYWQEDVGGVMARWAGGNEASRLRVMLPPGRAYEVTFVAAGYGARRRVQVNANGVTLGAFDLPASAGWSEHTLALPAEVVGDGDLLLVLVHGAPALAGDRPLTAAYDRIIFRAR